MDSPVTPAQRSLSAAIDRELLDVIENGQPLLDHDGHAVLDDTGKPIRRPASAAYFQAAIKRLQNLGLTKVVNPVDPANKLAAVIANLGKDLPPLDDEDDAATA